MGIHGDHVGGSPEHSVGTQALAFVFAEPGQCELVDHFRALARTQSDRGQPGVVAGVWLRVCSHTVNALINMLNPIRQSNYLKNFTINGSQFRRWRKRADFDMLQGKKLGQSFCEHFKITDYLLMYALAQDRAEAYIHDNYVR